MTYTHLRVGTKPFRSKPPRLGAPCNEPVVYGANIFDDPGVEIHLSNTGGGPNGDEIPGWDYVTPPLAQWSDSSPAPWNAKFYSDFDRIVGVDGHTIEDRRYKVITTSPDAGTYHIRREGKNYGWIDGDSAPGDALYLVKFKWCDDPAYDYWWAAKLAEGDFLRVSCRAKASSTSGAPKIWVGADFYNSAGSFIDGPTTFFALTASYATYQVSSFAPANTKYVAVYFGLSAATLSSVPSNITVDLDTFVIELT